MNTSSGGSSRAAATLDNLLDTYKSLNIKAVETFSAFKYTECLSVCTDLVEIVNRIKSHMDPSDQNINFLTSVLFNIMNRMQLCETYMSIGFEDYCSTLAVLTYTDPGTLNSPGAFNLDSASLLKDNKDYSIQSADGPITFDSIIGHSEIINELKSLKKSDAGGYERIKPPRLIMFFGPPGTGKTQLVYAMANYLGKKVVETRVSHFVTPVAGEGEQNMETFFYGMPEKWATSVCLMDECDSIFSARSSSAAAFENRLKTTALKGIDYVLASPSHGFTFFITNLISDIDPAIKRRMDAVYHVEGIRTTEDKYNMFVHLSAVYKVPVMKNVTNVLDSLKHPLFTQSYYKNMFKTFVSKCKILTSVIVEKVSKDQLISQVYNFNGDIITDPNPVVSIASPEIKTKNEYPIDEVMKNPNVSYPCITNTYVSKYYADAISSFEPTPQHGV